MMFLSAGVSYDPDAKAHFARMTSGPSPSRRAAIDRFIKSLRSAGVWSLGYHCCLLAGPTDSDARLDLFGDFDLGKTGSVAFLADRGFISPSNFSALTSGFIPSTHGLQNDFSIGEFIIGAPAANPSSFPQFGATDGTYYTTNWHRLDSDDKTYASVNQAAGTTSAVGAAMSGSNVSTLICRSGSSTTVVYRNGSSLGTLGLASTGRPTNAIYFVGANNNGSATLANHRVAISWIGRSLDSSQAAALDTASRAYLTAISAI